MTTINPFHRVEFVAVAMTRAPTCKVLSIDACVTYEQAEAAGLAMLARGEWRSFQIDKRYIAALENTRPIGSQGDHETANEGWA